MAWNNELTYIGDTGRIASNGLSKRVKTYAELNHLNFSVQKYSDMAMKNALKIAINKLLEFVEEDVYKEYRPTWYERSYALLKKDAWVYDKIAGNNVYSKYKIKLRDNYFRHRFNNNGISKQKFKDNVHMSNYVNATYDGNSVEMLTPEQLISIVNYGNHSPMKFDFPAMKARPFWNDFMYWMDVNFYNIYLNECKKLGLNVKSNASIGKFTSYIDEYYNDYGDLGDSY